MFIVLVATPIINGEELRDKTCKRQEGACEGWPLGKRVTSSTRIETAGQTVP